VWGRTPTFLCCSSCIPLRSKRLRFILYLAKMLKPVEYLTVWTPSLFRSVLALALTPNKQNLSIRQTAAPTWWQATTILAVYPSTLLISLLLETLIAYYYSTILTQSSHHCQTQYRFTPLCGSTDLYTPLDRRREMNPTTWDRSCHYLLNLSPWGPGFH